MSPKPATISPVVVCVLTFHLLISALSHAQPDDCPGYSSISEVLRQYGLPGGLFPDDVKSFRCAPVTVNKDDSLRLWVQLHGPCNVTRSLLMVENVVRCQAELSAIISPRNLNNIEGVTATLAFGGAQLGELMTVTQATVKATQSGKFLRFVSDKGPSPFFPVALFPNLPPKCDEARAYHSYASPKNNNRLIF